MYYVMRASAPSLHSVRPSDRLLRMREVYVEWFKGRSRSLVINSRGDAQRGLLYIYGLNLFSPS